jgi:hypothetical protein
MLLLYISFSEHVLINLNGKLSKLSARVKISAFLALLTFALIGVYASVTFIRVVPDANAWY